MTKSKYKELYLGALSGTSMDAIDLILVDFAVKPLAVIGKLSAPFPDALRKKCEALCRPGENELVRFAEADREFASAVAKAIHILLKKANVSPEDVRAIGSHGQTVRHHPDHQPGFTIQLGCPDTLAVKTGIPVISRFRHKDIALGGEGAPLAPALHQALFHSEFEHRAVVNLGGIANISWLPKTGDVTGFDCGPANTLLDGWYALHHSGSFDKDGFWAASGRVDEPLLNAMLSDSFFARKPPKSTGREYFTMGWLEEHLRAHNDLTPVDVQATLLELTARSLTDALKQHAPAQTVYLCGGGAHNRALWAALMRLAPSIYWHPTRTLGIEGDWVEAILFAWLAMRYMHHLPGNLKAVTGAQREAILGSYTPPH
ncbi:MAG: anhydro-N-acetylmuramic acid kinase [Idiomarina sp.]|nr:anhydro-N-acetylmuramic acid kinase [Idiomarina sp.]